tara:strand:- start:617 stop:901 length:285 start_codon:yes stop_codon:yes gene_type:complete
MAQYSAAIRPIKADWAIDDKLTQQSRSLNSKLAHWKIIPNLNETFPFIYVSLCLRYMPGATKYPRMGILKYTFHTDFCICINLKHIKPWALTYF